MLLIFFRFSEKQISQLEGNPLLSDTFYLHQGWDIIMSLSGSVNVQSLQDASGEIFVLK